MDNQRLRFVATGLTWVVSFAVALGSLVTLLGGGPVGVGVSLVIAIGIASGLYLLWPHLAKQAQTPVHKAPVFPTPKTPTKKSSPAIPSRVRVCDPGPYRVKPGTPTKIQLDVKAGDFVEGHLVEIDGWDFDWYIVDEANLVRYVNDDPKFRSLKEKGGEAASEVKCSIPHDGLWYLLLDLYQRQNYRDVEVNLYRANP